MNVADLVAGAAAEHGRRPAITEVGGAAMTWAQVEASVARGAGALFQAGIAPGDRVGLSLPNSAAFAVAYWAVLRAGAVAVPLNPAYTAREVRHMLTDGDVRAVVADATGQRTARRALRAAAAAHEVALLDPAALTESDTPGVAAGDISAREDRAVICYTSGTSGTPKGAVLTHTNLLANLAAFGDLERLTVGPGDVLYGVLPFFHVFGQNVVLNAAARAGAEILSVQRFSPGGSLEAMAGHRVTVAYGAPPMFAAWAAAGPPPGGLSELRGAVSGADALPVATFAGFHDRFGLEICEGYGLTETAPVLTSTAVSPRVVPGTVGHPLPGVAIELRGPDGQPVAVGSVGEIVAHGPNVFGGYHGQPEATAEVLADGWFRTGDLGRLDADGHLSIAGRIKDMVIVSGFNVYPREVEEVLVSHPDIAEAAVVGLPDPRTGERVRAVVVPAPGAPVDVEEILAFCRDQLARYKIPREIRVVGALPRTALGKVARRSLRTG